MKLKERNMTYLGNIVLFNGQMIIIHSQKELANWTIDTTAKFYACCQSPACFGYKIMLSTGSQHKFFLYLRLTDMCLLTLQGKALVPISSGMGATNLKFWVLNLQIYVQNQHQSTISWVECTCIEAVQILFPSGSKWICYTDLIYSLTIFKQILQKN